MSKLILLPLLFCGLIVEAQMYDAQWALGFDQSVVDFRSPDTVKIYS